MSKGSKGFVLEEMLRRHFLSLGFFVIRGVPFRLGAEDATDVDLWLYERPTGTSRRVQICDIKYKQRPKAVERILWTSGLKEALGADGAYVATTDKRNSLQALANRLGLEIIDGIDVARIQSSMPSTSARITDEQLSERIKINDSAALSKRLQEARGEVLSSLVDGFGEKSLVKSLNSFGRLADLAVKSRPDSEQASLAARLAYLAASIACISIDFVAARLSLRPLDDRRVAILNAVRMGALASDEGRRSLSTALGLISKYGPSGRAGAAAIERAIKADLEQIPAEVIADQSARLLKGDQIFLVAIELESACYASEFKRFDDIGVGARSMVGALLDYSGVDRKHFAGVVGTNYIDPESSEVVSVEQSALFSAAEGAKEKK